MKWVAYQAGTIEKKVAELVRKLEGADNWQVVEDNGISYPLLSHVLEPVTVARENANAAQEHMALAIAKLGETAKRWELVHLALESKTSVASTRIRARSGMLFGS